MSPEQHDSLDHFIESLVDIQWFEHAGETRDHAEVVPDVVVGWDDWNAQMLAVWKPNSEALEAEACEVIGDAAIDDIFNAVSVAIDEAARNGMQDYFNRRPANTPNTETNADLGLWPEALQTIKRDVSWAAVETVLGRPGLFSELMAYYRDGRWPCAWQGDYPSGKIVVL